jgi:hypothetical protein
VSLALSLHAPNQELRASESFFFFSALPDQHFSQIVPSSRSWKLEVAQSHFSLEFHIFHIHRQGIMSALDRFIDTQNSRKKGDRLRSVMIEYVLIGIDLALQIH